MQRIIKILLLMFMRSSLYRFTMTHIVPKIRFTTMYAAFTGKDYHEAYRLLKPCDIILTKDPVKLTGLLCPGYDHAELCIYAEDIAPYHSVGMHVEGLRKSFFFDVCKETKSICILRPKISDDIKKEILMKAKMLSKNNIKYDLEFSLNPEALYCSELIYHLLKDHVNFDLSDIHSLGQQYLSPQGIMDCKELDVIFEN